MQTFFHLPSSDACGPRSDSGHGQGHDSASMWIHCIEIASIYPTLDQGAFNSLLNSNVLVLSQLEDTLSISLNLDYCALSPIHRITNCSTEWCYVWFCGWEVINVASLYRLQIFNVNQIEMDILSLYIPGLLLVLLAG